MLQITSQNVKDSYAISLLEEDFQTGSLHKESNIRPNKIFTLDRNLILYKIGHLTDETLWECAQKVCDIVNSSEETSCQHNSIKDVKKEPGSIKGRGRL